MDSASVTCAIEDIEMSVGRLSRQISGGAEQGSPRTCLLALQRITELMETLEHCRIYVDNALTEIDDIGASCDAWTNKDNG